MLNYNILAPAELNMLTIGNASHLLCIGHDIAWRKGRLMCQFQGVFTWDEVGHRTRH